jgi:sugar transferase (PEP-CTERM/EpsH1 system associated)
MAQKPALAELARTHALVRRSKPLPLAGLEALWQRRPVSLSAFDHAAMHRYVAKTLGNHAIDTIFVFSGQMGQYVPPNFVGRVIVDLCDVDSAKFDAYADAGNRRWLNRREARLLALEEERLAARADTTLLISEAEAQLFRSRLRHAGSARLRALGNGIDADFFDPALMARQADLEEGDGPQIVFTGQMDYAPNIAAALWMIDEIMPRLRRAHARARFHVVGRSPGRSLSEKHGEHGARIWGEVPDVRPFLKSADIVVAPLLIARGVQNKVLEAMAMARPVVLTPGAATGIGAEDGNHFAIAQADPEAIVAGIDALVADPGMAETMGAAARRFVVEHMGWEAVADQLGAVLDQPRDACDAA